MLSLIIPIRPLGSAADMATPATSGLCSRSFHSSVVKSAFVAMLVSLVPSTAVVAGFADESPDGSNALSMLKFLILLEASPEIEPGARIYSQSLRPL